MSADREKRIEQIFHAACELSPEQRSSFVDEACGGDAELRAEVESLLAHDERADEVLPTAGGGELRITQTTPSSNQASSQTERIGPYRILRELGEGGMGQVYLAQQEQPIRRRVALKLIKLGMDSKQVVARFEAERQALAIMNHPNVAKVFDAGVTEQGRPYFTMEYVKGEPITTYCDRHLLTTKERLGLFVDVCNGVQHSHEKGIIHRDIKPSNVLVTIQDNKPVPQIIDFGVAKAVELRLTEATVFTQMGVLIGTPEYMSPEQAELTELEIDTRTDVYSLGMLLYELLVGALPFDPGELRNASLDEIRRKIREDDVSKPSTRLTTIGDASTESARRRRTDVATLRRQLRGDLDWITLKALEKDRTRRYASPAELAGDLDRHLKGLPVTARPPSATYRVSKAIRRNWPTSTVGRLAVVGLAASALLFAALAYRSQQRPMEGAWSPPVMAEVRQLTFTGEALLPLWSPDGQAIAFHGGGIGPQVVSAGGGTARTLPYPEVTVWNWTPSGAGLLGFSFDQEGETWRGHVVRIGLQGEDPEILVEDGRFPDMSPDGRYLAYASNLSDDGIWLLDLSTGEKQLLIARHEEGTAAYKPQWSPDGNRIAYHRWNGHGHELWLYDLQSRVDRPIATEPVNAAGHFDWTSDGRWVVCGGLSRGVWSIWKFSVEGEPPVRLTFGSEVERHVTVAPDDAAVAFTREQEISRIGVVDLQNRETTYPFELSVATRQPTVSLDGNQIVFQALINGRWQLWIGSPESGEGPRLLAASADVSAMSPAATRTDQILYLRSDVTKMGVFGRIDWEQTLWSVSTDGQRQRRIDVAGDRVSRLAPSPSPSGEALYSIHRDEGGESLYLLEDGGSPQLVFEDGDDASFYAFDWGPHDDEIVLLLNDPPNRVPRVITTLNLQTHERRIITTIDSLAVDGDTPISGFRALALSPDRAHLAILAGKATNSEIYVLDLRDSSTEWVFASGSDEHLDSVTWFPDGRRLAMDIHRERSDIFVAER